MALSNVTLPEDLKQLLEPEYILRRALGSGAFGDVFEAIQTSTEQLVAIKVLRAAETESARKRFRMEMRACAALHHPHIVRVVDAGREDSASSAPLYTVFEYVPGENLADRIAREGMLPVEEALGLMLQVLDALQAAHRLGIVHRDLKPANIMVIQGTGSLQAKVLDFGISAWLQSTRDIGPRLTQSGERLGTPAYCAPEQLRGEPSAIQVDYYAWGLVLLECLTGKHPFGAVSMHEILHAQFSSTPVPIPRVIAEHPLGDLLRWTLEKNASRRVSDPQYLANRLRRLNLKTLCDEAGYLLGGDDEWRASTAGSTEVSGLGRVRTERRPLTALCCRMALGHGLDVDSEEALDEWLDDLRDTIVQIAQRNGGRLMGSGGAELIVYFGLEASGEAG
ncbi:MAG: serine/threonine-protein kinase, partial [Polyangiaceae bacterium]